MKETLRKACAAVGGTTLIMGAGIVTENPIVMMAWLAISVSLLYAGRAFDFQQKQ